MQEDFLEVMQTYPESSKAMDLVAEHRLRSLHRSQAWQARQRQPDDSPHLGGIIKQILQVGFLVCVHSMFGAIVFKGNERGGGRREDG